MMKITEQIGTGRNGAHCIKLFPWKWRKKKNKKKGNQNGDVVGSTAHMLYVESQPFLELRVIPPVFALTFTLSLRAFIQIL